MIAPKGHPSTATGDYESCPYLRNQGSKTSGGSCPVMNVEESKKNPKLGPAKFGVDIPFISPFDFAFGEDRAFSRKRAAKRDTFNSCPKHLKTTIFLDDPKLDKIRGLEFMQRYMVVDEIREQGNECYFRGDYAKAIGTYTMAYACLRWLSYAEPEVDTPKTEDSTDMSQETAASKIAAITSQLSPDLQAKLKLDLLSVAEHAYKQQAKPKVQDERLRKFTASFDDSNVKLMSDDKLTCQHDIGMRKIGVNQATTCSTASC